MSSSRKDKGQVGSSKKKSTSKGASSATAGTSGFLSGAAAAASASPENQIHEELADVNAAIAKVENKIAKVENKISTIEDQLDDKDKYWKKLSDQDRKEEYDNDRTKWVKELKDEKKQLLRKEEQLRDEEEQLRDEKKQLSSAGSGGQLSVQEVCKTALDGALEKWDGKPPSLGVFEATVGAPLATYLRTDMEIPTAPGDPSYPVLLFHDVDSDSHKEKPVYTHIEKASKLGPTALYGTSGAGKTRSVFEYLSDNRGLYFLANTKRNAGSADFVFLLQHLKKNLPRFLYDNEQKAAVSDKNLAVVATWVDTLMYVRQAVFKRVEKRLQREPTPYEWMLLQLYPREFFGEDVFLTATKACRRKANPATASKDFDDNIWDVCFVDEAQELLNELPSMFLSNKGEKSRSAFSAFLRAFDAMGTSGVGGFPVFCGTGLSIDALREESGSVMAKQHRNPYELVFAGLAPLDVVGVKTYLGTFLDLDKMVVGSNKRVLGSDLVDHACNWLRGRPRWTATFVEMALLRSNLPEHMVTRGLEETELGFIQALDWYINVITTGTRGKRGSWTLNGATALAVIHSLMEKSGKSMSDKQGSELSSVQQQFFQDVFKFVVGGNRVTFSSNATTLIEAGVAAVSIADGNNVADAFNATLDEPLIVQAAVNYFGLHQSVKQGLVRQIGDAGKGDAFEQFILPDIQANFRSILEGQLGGGVLSGFNVSQISAYGVLAKDCKGSIDETIKWIRSSTDADLRFDGQIPPFCYPDDHFGPDLIFLLRNESFKGFYPVLCQSKLSNDVKQADALRTIVPELLYYQGRNKKPTESKALSAVQQKAWVKARTGLLQCDATGKNRQQNVIRFMVQYPSEATSSAVPGLVAFGEYGVCKKSCKHGHHDDGLVTIHGDNADMLFVENGKRMLECLQNLKPKRSKQS